MKIVRGRLYAGDVSNPALRYSADCDCIQRTADNGATWHDSPSDDPRTAIGFRTPPRTGSDIQCQAAYSKMAWIKNFIDYELPLMEAGATLTGIANTLLLFIDLLFPGAILITLLLEIASTLFSVGATALAAAFTSTEYDLLQCIFYCNSDTAGQVTHAQLIQTMTDVTAQLNATAALIVNAILGAQGENGLSNAGSLYTGSPDCSACGCAWCYHFDAADRLSEWTALEWNGVCDALPTYSSGVWNSGLVTCGHTVSYVHLRWVLSSAIFLTDAAAHSPEMPANRTIWVNGDGSLFSGTEVWNGGWLGGAGISTTSIDILFFMAIDTGTPFTLDWAQFSGINVDNPFGTNNC